MQSFKVSKDQKNRAYYRIYSKYIDMMEREGIPFYVLTSEEKEKFLYAIVMYLVTLDQRSTKNMKDARETHAMYDSVITLLSSLTPSQLVRMFPIDKYYDGEKYEMKDYFSTREVIDKLPQDEPIHLHIDMVELMWDYCNTHIRHLLTAAMCGVDEIRKWMGKCSMMEEYLWKLQTDEWKKVKPRKRQLPAWLKIVK